MWKLMQSLCLNFIITWLKKYFPRLISSHHKFCAIFSYIWLRNWTNKKKTATEKPWSHCVKCSNRCTMWMENAKKWRVRWRKCLSDEYQLRSPCVLDGRDRETKIRYDFPFRLLTVSSFYIVMLPDSCARSTMLRSCQGAGCQAERRRETWHH